MIAMLVSPTAAVMVGLGSTLGFLLIMGPVVAATCFCSRVFRLGRSLINKKRLSFQKALIYVAPIHALGEALIVLPLGFNMHTAFVVVGIGTLLHHFIDSAVSVGLVKALSAGLSLSGKKV
jgi:niacin transporter